MSKGGRPTDYKPEYAEAAYKLTLLGLTDAQLAIYLGVTEQTVNNWKVKHPEFFESIKKGKELADVAVVQSLYKRATGFEYTEQHVEKIKVGENQERIVTKAVKKQVVPDTTATIFWLKNRQPKAWRDKVEVDANVTQETIVGFKIVEG
jgi:hypothetical protein